MIRFGAWTAVFLAAGAAVGQTGDWRGSPAGPDRPAAPFQLTPQQKAYLDQVLQAWEQRNAGVKTFECDFTRWQYDPVFGDANKPKYRDDGHLKYAPPDRGRFDIKGERPEKWICNGKSIFEFNYAKKQLIEYKLPPDMQGRAIADSPLPFLFGAKAGELKRRYFLRIITPAGAKGQIWLEAHPKFQQDAANFKRAELILIAQGMTPYGLQIYLPNGKNRTAYQFYNIVTNDPLRFFKGDPFRAVAPPFWKKIVEQPRK